MPRFFSFWILGPLALLLALQQVPYLNLILLVVGAAAWCGLLVHGFLLCLLFEAVVGQVPRVLIIIPLVAYGGYLYLYVQQGKDIDDKAREMQLSNPSAVLQFDPDQYSLVLPASRAENLAQYYNVSVAYSVNANFLPEGYLSYRLLDREQCVRARSLRNNLRGQKVSPAAILVGPVKFDNTFLSEACLLRFPEKPQLQQIVVTDRGDNAVWKHERAIMEQFVDFSIDGRVFATYRTASLWRLSALPLPLIGCGLSGGNLSWGCSVDFHRTYQVIDGTPKNVDKTLHDSPESIVLGLRKFARGDYAQFKGDSRSAAFIERIGAYSGEQDKYKTERK
ncbi:hypothetical protein JQ594_29065 [Bradyrhizobium manausense]|uniref:hypothetical protein n=1 Tax=Bradyrhizobium manausense TaxID=989370 RepID=UPI001BA882DC|nr:hypothetical protein [Bradyrhizobium manausense]MBR0689992.1 hypothetical protein [Bradyrhizobium manausense]